MDPAAKQQIVERIKQANNVLVTVSANPTIDQLAACIGLTLLLNKMDKHATAVFSGKVPSTIEFLQPEKTLEKNTDSLRDFIISLDKNKADKLRYKVEDQVVRIYISPYKTSLSEKDLVFSQGDFNVELVLALGIVDRAHLDAAIAAHGRILHDATVVAMNTGAAKGQGIGQINWQDPAASSLCEIIVGFSEAFGPGMIDNQIATAFLTGIVAETERFSNKRTSPKVMTMSAQLMAAGANQQLVISKLEPPPPPKPAPTALATSAGGSDVQSVSGTASEGSNSDGVLSVAHEPAESDSPEVEINSEEIRIDESGNLQGIGDQPSVNPVAAQPVAASNSSTSSSVSAINTASPVAPSDAVQAASPVPPVPTEPYVPTPPPPMPVQTSQAAPLSTPSVSPATPAVSIPPPSATSGHMLMDPMAPPPSFGSSFSSDTGMQNGQDPYGSVPIDPLNNDPNTHQEAFSGYSKTITPPSEQTPAANPLPPSAMPMGNTIPAPAANPDAARSAVESAYASVPFNPDSNPVQALNAQPLVPEVQPPQTTTPSLNLPFGGQAPPSSAPTTVSAPLPPVVNPTMPPPPPAPPPIPQMPV